MNAFGKDSILVCPSSHSRDFHDPSSPFSVSETPSCPQNLRPLALLEKGIFSTVCITRGIVNSKVDLQGVFVKKSVILLVFKGFLVEFQTEQAVPEKIKDPRKSPDLSLAFYNAPSLHC